VPAALPLQGRVYVPSGVRDCGPIRQYVDVCRRALFGPGHEFRCPFRRNSPANTRERPLGPGRHAVCLVGELHSCIHFTIGPDQQPPRLFPVVCTRPGSQPGPSGYTRFPPRLGRPQGAHHVESSLGVASRYASAASVAPGLYDGGPARGRDGGAHRGRHAHPAGHGLRRHRGGPADLRAVCRPRAAARLPADRELAAPCARARVDRHADHRGGRGGDRPGRDGALRGRRWRWGP
jgi:hypothetical protein